jgi:hypothetical protein
VLPYLIFLLIFAGEYDSLWLSKKVIVGNRPTKITSRIFDILIEKWELTRTMYDRLLNRMRRLVVERQYIVTAHAYDEMAADDLAIWDVESAILTGVIVERQKDRTSSENKYRLQGKALNKSTIEVVVKFGATGKLVVITVYGL